MFNIASLQFLLWVRPSFLD